MERGHFDVESESLLLSESRVGEYSGLLIADFELRLCYIALLRPLIRSFALFPRLQVSMNELQSTQATTLTFLDLATTIFSIIGSGYALTYLLIGPGEYDPKGILNKMFFYDVPTLKGAKTDYVVVRLNLACSIYQLPSFLHVHFLSHGLLDTVRCRRVSTQASRRFGRRGAIRIGASRAPALISLTCFCVWLLLLFGVPLSRAQ